MFTDTDTRSTWQRRAARAGFQVWNNRKLADMTDTEVQAAFEGLATDKSLPVNIRYVWATQA